MKICENCENGTCKTTNRSCRYVPTDPEDKIKSQCLFLPRFLKNERIRRMVAAIRAVKVGSSVTVIFRTRYGWYAKEVIDSAQGEVVALDEFGIMKVRVRGWRGEDEYLPENFTRILFLNPEEVRTEMNRMQEELEKEQRIQRESREG